MAVLLPNEVPDLVLVLAQQVRHIHLLGLVPGEGQVQLAQGAVRQVLLQLLPVQVVFVPLAAAKVQHHLPNGLACQGRKDGSQRAPTQHTLESSLMPVECRSVLQKRQQSSNGAIARLQVRGAMAIVLLCFALIVI